MSLVNGWLELFLGLLLIGFIIVLLKVKKVTKNVKLSQKVPLFAPRYLQDWERHFSWTPVRTIDKGRVWLRYYWRRKIYTPAPTGAVDVLDRHGNVEHPYVYQHVIRVEWYLW